MKKYWKLVVLSAVAVFGLALYYIQMSAEAKEELTLHIETLDGNAAHLDDYTFVSYASYGGNARMLALATEPSVIRADTSLMSELVEKKVPLAFTPYVEQYSSFMRGKNLSQLQMYEDDTRLVSVLAPNSDAHAADKALTIEVLAKDTEQVESFEALIPSSERYNWLDATNVYMEDNFIKVLAVATLNDARRTQELHLFTIDGEVVNDTLLGKLARVGDAYTTMEMDAVEHPTAKQEWYSYRTIVEEPYAGEMERRLTKAFAFHSTNGDVKEINLPKEIVEPVTFTRGNMFYAVNKQLTYTDVHVYDLQKETWQEPVRVAYDDVEWNNVFVDVRDGYVYTVGDTLAGDSRVFVHQLTNGDVVYKGQVVNAHGPTHLEMFVLSMLKR